VRILAISLDLDDTLWPVEPAIRNAEQRLDEWLRAEHPDVAAKFPIAEMRALRDAIDRERPDLAHDFTAQRLLTIERAFAACGFGAAHVADAFEVYYAARNAVECYADTLPALAALSARMPIVSLSNGNADLGRIGLRHHFRDCISARDVGYAKPHARIFEAACDKLGVAPQHVLHVGDDPHLDVGGARGAGLRSAWLNRGGAAWSHGPSPDLTIADLNELAAWILARAA
jgi:FMN hydrolase / 5-amino-6-(5-phospho-D-ribitylamino)uracil phosphatase